MPAVHRLVAILAADVAGYSRLMGADEEGTHERLKAHRRELVEPKISEHSGRIRPRSRDPRGKLDYRNCLPWSKQVMRPGVALEYRREGFPRALLTGRSAHLVATMGMPALAFNRSSHTWAQR